MTLLDRIRYRLHALWAGWRMPPIAGAEGEGEGESGKEAGKEGEGEPAGKAGEGEPEGEPAGEPEEGSGEPDWKAQSRKHERREKQERKKREKAEAALKEREDADKSEQEKAVEQAREEGRKAAAEENEKARRSDRLEVAVTRLAAKGFKVGEGDDAKTVKFADAEDAQVNIERAINRGEIEASDIFDDEGKVQTVALQSELADLLERKPHLGADAKETQRPSGDADAGKGSGSGKDLEDLSVEEHAKRQGRVK